MAHDCQANHHRPFAQAGDHRGDGRIGTWRGRKLKREKGGSPKMREARRFEFLTIAKRLEWTLLGRAPHQVSVFADLRAARLPTWRPVTPRRTRISTAGGAGKSCNGVSTRRWRPAKRHSPRARHDARRPASHCASSARRCYVSLRQRSFLRSPAIELRGGPRRFPEHHRRPLSRWLNEKKS